MLSPLTYYIILAMVCGYAFYRGQSESRLAASICVIASLASMIVVSPLGYARVESGIFIVDVAVLVGFTVIALRSDRFWPLWIAGLQLTTIIAHLFKVVDLDLLPKVYAAAARFWVYPIFLIIVIGTWRSHQRRRRERDGLAFPS
jgi:nicotinamide riboside transporter PnuC